MRAHSRPAKSPRHENPCTRWSLPAPAGNSTHAFLPTVTLMRPHSRPRSVKRSAVPGRFSIPLPGPQGTRGAPLAPPRPPALAIISFDLQGLTPIREVREGARPIPCLAAGIGRGAHPPPGSSRLPTKEGRDFELIVLIRIMHSSLASMGVQTLMWRPLCVFRHRFGP